MIIEFLDTILIDKSPVADNLRLNIKPETRQLRLKLNWLNQDRNIPIDLVIYNWSPYIDKLKFNLSIDGKELTSNKSFIVDLSYDIFKRRIKVKGNIGEEDVKYTASNIKDLLEITIATVIK